MGGPNPLFSICDVERWFSTLYTIITVGAELIILSLGYNTALRVHSQTFRNMADPESDEPYRDRDGNKPSTYPRSCG